MTASERLRLLAAAAGLAAAALLVSGGRPVVRAGGALLAVAAFLLLAAVRTRREEERELSGLQPVVAHLRPSADEWAAFVALERRRALRTIPRASAAFLVPGLADVLLGPPRPEAGGLLLAALLAGWAAVGAVFGAGVAALRWAALDALAEETPPVTIEPRRVVAGALAVRWARRAPSLPGGYELRRAAVESEAPGHLTLSLSWRSLGLTLPGLGMRVRLPVPADRVEEARRSAARLEASAGLVPPASGGGGINGPAERAG